MMVSGAANTELISSPAAMAACETRGHPVAHSNTYLAQPTSLASRMVLRSLKVYDLESNVCFGESLDESFSHG